MNRIRTALLTPIAFAIFVKEELAAEKEARARRDAEACYDAYIAECQTKIGPYVPQPCPKQIWA